MRGAHAVDLVHDVEFSIAFMSSTERRSILVLTCAYVRVRRLARGIARFRIRVLDSVQLGKRLGLRERRNLVAQLRELDGGEETRAQAG